MGALSPTHWVIIIGVLVVLFGAKRLPDAARSLGRSARILKAEVQEAGKDDKAAEATQTPDGGPVVDAPKLVEPAVAGDVSPPSTRMSA